MNINFNTLTVSRVVMHTINQKTGIDEHATVTSEPTLLGITNEVLETIRKRLIDAAGKNSKAFELELGPDAQLPGSFFEYANQLSGKSDEDFLADSIVIAELLAESQKRTGIPGGYFILLECSDDGRKVYVVIKAEPHEALQKVPGQTQVSFLSKVFLSPSQRLFKIGILAEHIDPSGTSPNDIWDCYLFDDQFRTESHPAEYFYKDFLGFSIGNNSKIQSSIFYTKTEKFLVDKIADIDTKTELLDTLRQTFITDQAATVSPNEWCRENLPSEYRDAFIADVATELPLSIVKDPVMFKSKLNNKKIGFDGDIKLSGPSADFWNNVQLLTNEVEIANAIQEASDSGEKFTIVKIKGHPFKS